MNEIKFGGCPYCGSQKCVAGECVRPKNFGNLSDFFIQKPQGNKMLTFIDCEFNGFGGKLMSMALVPQDPNFPEFYEEIEIKDQIEPWVQTNVVPHMFKAPVSYSEFQAKLANFLWDLRYNDITIVADWPDDLRYFMEATITGPGNRINMPTVIDFKLDLNIEYNSVVPHNALHDARAIRDVYLGK